MASSVAVRRALQQLWLGCLLWLGWLVRLQVPGRRWVLTFLGGRGSSVSDDWAAWAPPLCWPAHSLLHHCCCPHHVQ